IRCPTEFRLELCIRPQAAAAGSFQHAISQPRGCNDELELVVPRFEAQTGGTPFSFMNCCHTVRTGSHRTASRRLLHAVASSPPGGTPEGSKTAVPTPLGR